MKILLKNLKNGLVKVRCENLDDLWYLSNIIEPDDKVSGSTIRKIKIGDSGDRKQSVVKKHVFMTLEVERLEFSEYSDVLRVSGKITEGPDDVSLGSYHTFNVEIGTDIKIIKTQWPNYQLKRLDEASKVRQSNILIVAMDREDATIAILERSGVKILTTIRGVVKKKTDLESKDGNFYAEIEKALQGYDERYKAEKIVVGSPAFFKEDFLKVVKDSNLKKKILLAGCNDTGGSGINEILKRDEVKKALSEERVSRELKLAEQLLSNISRGQKYAYGMCDVKKAADAGAVITLLTTDGLIKKLRQEENYHVLDGIMKLAEAGQAEVHIISSDNDGGKKLDGIGGIGAILRYDLTF